MLMNWGKKILFDPRNYFSTQKTLLQSARVAQITIMGTFHIRSSNQYGIMLEQPQSHPLNTLNFIQDKITKCFNLHQS